MKKYRLSFIFLLLAGGIMFGQQRYELSSPSILNKTGEKADTGKVDLSIFTTSADRLSFDVSFCGNQVIQEFLFNFFLR